MQVISILFGIIGCVLTVGSIVYVYLINREKERFEKLVKATMGGIAGGILMIRTRSRLADGHCRKITEYAVKLPSNDDVQEIIHQARDGARDSMAAYDGLGHLLNNVFALQDGLFGERTIQHPDRREGEETKQ